MKQKEFKYVDFDGTDTNLVGRFDFSAMQGKGLAEKLEDAERQVLQWMEEPPFPSVLSNLVLTIHRTREMLAKGELEPVMHNLLSIGFRLGLLQNHLAGVELAADKLEAGKKGRDKQSARVKRENDYMESVIERDKEKLLNAQALIVQKAIEHQLQKEPQAEVAKLMANDKLETPLDRIRAVQRRMRDSKPQE